MVVSRSHPSSLAQGLTKTDKKGSPQIQENIKDFIFKLRQEMNGFCRTIFSDNGKQDEGRPILKELSIMEERVRGVWIMGTQKDEVDTQTTIEGLTGTHRPAWGGLWRRVF